MATATRLSAKLQSEEIKDAYRVWLKDLHDDKPEKLLRKLDKKKKHGGGRRAQRNQRPEHAQQHTAASSLKDVALKKVERAKLPPLSLVHTAADKLALQESQNRRHQALAEDANYSAFQYVHQPSWRPGLAFFQQLVRHLLQKSSPETTSNDGASSSEGIVSAELVGFPVLVAPILLRVPVRRQRKGSRLGVALLFCQEQSQEQQQVIEANGDFASIVLHCRVYLRASSWREHRNALLDIVSNSSAEICALRKCAENFESRNNELQLLRSRQEVETAMDALWVDSNHTDDVITEYESDLLAIQKYIPFKGATSTVNAFTAPSTMTASAERKAWIARCASRKRDKKSSTVWIISGGDACVSSDSSSTAITNSSSASCQLVKCTIDQAWFQPRLLASMCAMPLERALRVRFNELVVDLLQDTSGTWWLLQVKAFTLASIRPASAATAPVFCASSLSKKIPRGLSRTQSAPTRFEAGIVPTPQWKKWRCAGRYCATNTAGKKSMECTNQQIDEDFDDNKEPCGYLTKKMVRSCEFYDDFVQQQDMSLAGGFANFHSALAFHLQHRLPKRDRSQFYEPQPLCSACLKRYHSLRQQWIVTVEVPKATATSNTIAGHRRKMIHSKMKNEQAELLLIPLRKLPSLHHEPEVSPSLNTSYSTSTLPASSLGTHTKSSSKQEDIVSKRPNYLDELAAMEEMLAEHEPPSIVSKTKRESQSPEQRQTATIASSSSLNALSSKSSGPDDIFPKWNGVSRIEEMWQNLSFKPLETQLTDPGSSLSDGCGTKQGYNSISLQQELATVDNIEENDQQSVPEPRKINQPAEAALVKSVAAHTVHVQHCRRVFEAEIYREDLVNDALSAFRSGKPNVCFVVTPHNRNSEKQRTGEDEDELAEMALRSLYIDVKQGIAAASDEFASDLSLSSWPMRPKVCRETSGCITVKLGPV